MKTKEMFNQLKLLSTMPIDVMKLFSFIESHEEGRFNNVLVICPTAKSADTVFRRLAEDYLDKPMRVSKREVDFSPLSTLYVAPLNDIEKYIRGRNFKKIYFMEE